MKSFYIFGLLLVCLGIAACAAESAAVHQKRTEVNAKPSPIRCWLTCTQDSRRVYAELSFSNTTDSAVAVLERNFLRKDGLESSTFDVSRNGAKVAYTGIMIKRRAPTAADFYRMKAHEVVKAKVDLSTGYDFSTPGNYVVKYFAVNPTIGDTNFFVIESDPISLNIP